MFEIESSKDRESPLYVDIYGWMAGVVSNMI